MPICIYKKRGETPLQSLERLRVEEPKYKNETLSYAGRLDPMAEGLMLILVGDENKEREKYLGLDKTYEVEILFGFATDTGDVLGLIEKADKKETKKHKGEIENELQKFVGAFRQPYPKYSSKSIANNFDQENLEPKEVNIYSIKVKSWKEIPTNDLKKEILTDIDKVFGDFRQNEIKAMWSETLSDLAGHYLLLTISVHCSSGTYMRSLAHNLGIKVGIPALAYRINRLQISDYCDTISR